MLNKKEYLLTSGLFLLAIILSFFFTFNNYSSSLQKETKFTGNVIFEQKNSVSYNPILKRVTDKNGLSFYFNKDKILINNKRFFYFAIQDKEDIYSFEKPEFNQDSQRQRYNLSNKEDFDGLLLKENLIFDNANPLKITHFLKNNKNVKIENPVYYYIFEVFPEDRIIINGTQCDYLGNCEYLGKDKKNRINFNAEYDFNFDDLIINNFTLSDIKFKKNELWIGFSNNYSLNGGDFLELDPTFSVNSVDTLSASPIGQDKVIIAWEDGTEQDATYAIYYINGTQLGSDVDINSTLRWTIFASHGISVSAFNSTHFVIGFYNHQANGVFFFNTRDIYGGNLSLLPVNSGGSWDDAAAVSVSALNSTHFVIAWTNDAEDDIEARVYNVFGEIASPLIEPDLNFGTGVVATVSVSALNSTHFVIGWYDNSTSRIYSRVYQSDGVAASPEILVDNYVGDASRTVQVASFNSTHFAITWYDRSYDDVFTKVYDSNGNPNTGDISADDISGVTRWTSITTINSTHYIVGWMDSNENDASIKGFNSNGINYTGAIIDASTSAQYDLALASEIPSTGVQLCNDLFVFAWRDNSSSARWSTFFSNGTQGYSLCNPISISIHSPLNQTYVSKEITFNISATSINSSISKCFYSLNGGLNYSLTNSAGNFWSANRNLSYGPYEVSFYCNESANIWNSEKISFFIDDSNSSCTWWYNPSWSYRKNIIINKNMVNGTQLNFPLFINITDVSLKLYSQENGNDILFTDVGGCNKLYHEIEFFNKSYNSTHSYLVAWVKIPVLSNTSNTIIYMYYGNSLSGNQQSDINVWGEGYSSVWHLTEDPSIAGDFGIKDSTIFRNNATDYGMSSTNKIFSIGGYGLNFDGLNDRLEVSPSSSLNSNNTLTVEFWIKDGGGPDNRDVITKTDFSTSGWRFLNYAGDEMELLTYMGGDSTTQTTGSGVTNGSWHHFCAVLDSGNVYFYVDGIRREDDTTYTHGRGFYNTEYLTIGATYYGTGNYSGTLDEIRISNITRTDSWINTTYMNMAYPYLFYSVGGEKPYTCNYIGFGNWFINCSDNCTLDSETILDKSNITIAGSGHIFVTSNISNFTKISINGVGGVCRVTCLNGGCFKK